MTETKDRRIQDNKVATYGASLMNNMGNTHIRPPVRFVKAHPEAVLPAYGSKEAVGADVRSVETLVIQPGETKLVQTGLNCDILPGYEIQVRSRSGLAVKNSVFVLNSPGTVDPDYTGGLGVILCNAGDKPFEINLGDRIAQIVVAPVLPQVKFEWTEEQRATDRGEGGYGSTGVK